MPSSVEPSPADPSIDAIKAVCAQVLSTLTTHRIPFLVGGSMAMLHYTGEDRITQDLDLCLLRDDVPRALDSLGRAGLSTELTHPHWLGKAHAAGYCVDLIFSSGNGACPVDDGWFAHAREVALFGQTVRIVPPEELLWTKLLIMERERYDGADVAHMLRDAAGVLDWPRLIARVGPHWRVLLSHLVLFGFIYPSEQAAIPAWVLDDLLRRLADETGSLPLEPPLPEPSTPRLCRGTLLSRQQYLRDVHDEGYLDARLTPLGGMSASEVATWTRAIDGESATDPRDDDAGLR